MSEERTWSWNSRLQRVTGTARDMLLPIIAGIVIMSMAAEPVTAEAQSVSSMEERMESAAAYVDDALRQLNMPGASLAIVLEGEIVHIQAWGVTGGDRTPVAGHTPFLVGSNSKALTAYGVMLLIQEGKVELEAPVQRYVPWFSLQDDEAASRITVKQLLSHTSGLSALTGMRIADLGAHDDEAIERIVRQLSAARLSYPLGERYDYSAANYAVLGAMIEQVSGVTFAQFMEDRIFQPLGMENAAANVQTATDKGWKPGYRSWFGLPAANRATFDNGGAPYGYISASAEDMARFLVALQKPGAVLSPASTEQYMQPLAETNSASAYGYGWRLSERADGIRQVWHGGSTSDFRSEVFLLPEAGWGVVLLTNRGHALEADRLSFVSRGIADILLGHEPEELRVPAVKERWIAGVVLAVLLTLVAGLTVAVRRSRVRPRFRWVWAGGAVLSGLLAVSLIALLPRMTGIPWRGLLLFAPDMALLLGATVAALLGNGFLAACYGFKRR